MARDRGSRPAAKPLRLFVAIEVPDEACAAVAAAVAPWREAFPTARWVPPGNWHVTVKFLGSTWPRLAAWVPERVAEAAAACETFETRWTSLGSFPVKGKARVLWAGLDDRDGRMARIADALDTALAREFRPERRAFSPHVTVARSDPPLELSAAFSETAVEPVAFRVEGLALFRSHLQRPAPRYERLEDFRFAGQSGPF